MPTRKTRLQAGAAYDPLAASTAAAGDMRRLPFELLRLIAFGCAPDDDDDRLPLLRYAYVTARSLAFVCRHCAAAFSPTAVMRRARSLRDDVRGRAYPLRHRLNARRVQTRRALSGRVVDDVRALSVARSRTFELRIPMTPLRYFRVDAVPHDARPFVLIQTNEAPTARRAMIELVLLNLGVQGMDAQLCVVEAASAAPVVDHGGKPIPCQVRGVDRYYLSCCSPAATIAESAIVARVTEWVISLGDADRYRPDRLIVPVVDTLLGEAMASLDEAQQVPLLRELVSYLDVQRRIAERPVMLQRFTT